MGNILFDRSNIIEFERKKRRTRARDVRESRSIVITGNIEISCALFSIHIHVLHIEEEERRDNN